MEVVGNVILDCKAYLRTKKIERENDKRGS